MFDWNDLRLFLAVARHGSTNAAARALGLNQTTVSRRIEVLEHQLGLSLFIRTTRGYALTEQGRAILAAAEPMQAAAEALELVAGGVCRALTGTIRVTAPEIVLVQLVAPIAAEFRAQHPEVMIEYLSLDTFADLVHGEADIAFRSTEAPLDDGLVGRKVGEFGWTVYCSTDYAARHGMPASVAEVSAHPVVTLGGQAGERPGTRWLMKHVDPKSVVAVSNTVPGLGGILRTGAGVGPLPCLHGDREPGLRRCFPPPPEMRASFWLLTSEQRRNVPRIAAFTEFAARSIRARRRELQGELVAVCCDPAEAVAGAAAS